LERAVRTAEQSHHARRAPERIDGSCRWTRAHDTTIGQLTFCALAEKFDRALGRVPVRRRDLVGDRARAAAVAARTDVPQNNQR
jgi:hypothetical protein